MRRLSVIVLLLAVVFAAAGLAAAQTIVIWDRETVQTEEAVALFNKKMEEEGRSVRAEFQLVPYEQQTQLFLAALSAGTAPDVISLDIVLHPYFNSIGAFLDITDRINALPFRDAMPDGMLHLGSKDGRYAIPYTVDLSGLVWNKDLSQAGLDRAARDMMSSLNTPSSQRTSITMDRSTNMDSDRRCFSWLADVWFMPVVWSFGGRLLSDDGTGVLIDSPEAIAALQMWWTDPQVRSSAQDCCLGSFPMCTMRS